MKTIVWMSRHKPTSTQLVELARLFGKHKLVRDRRSFSGADEIVARFKEYGGDEMVLVAPLSVAKEIVRRGIKPLWAKMQQIPCEDPYVEIRTKGRCYRFIRFERLAAIDIKLDPLEPNPNPFKSNIGE